MLKDKQIIKVVTGVRRCGKSTLLKQFQEYLKSCGVEERQIISINFEDVSNEPLMDYKALHDFVVKQLIPGKMTYVFLDEVQAVPQYQKAVDSLFIRDNVDLYITGSNAYLLSGELATLLSGRFIEIQCCRFPLLSIMSLSEETRGCMAGLFQNGGFPFAAL